MSLFFGSYTDVGVYLMRPVFLKHIRSYLRFQAALFSSWSSVNAKQKRIDFAPFSCIFEIVW